MAHVISLVNLRKRTFYFSQEKARKNVIQSNYYKTRSIESAYDCALTNSNKYPKRHRAKVFDYVRDMLRMQLVLCWYLYVSSVLFTYLNLCQKLMNESTDICACSSLRCFCVFQKKKRKVGINDLWALNTC